MLEDIEKELQERSLETLLILTSPPNRLACVLACCKLPKQVFHLFVPQNMKHLRLPERESSYLSGFFRLKVRRI